MASKSRRQRRNHTEHMSVKRQLNGPIRVCAPDSRDSSRISPASTLDTLQLTLDIHTALAAPKRP
jgi:hypothetical protein